MTSRNNCEVSAQPGPRKPSSDSDRGRKRDRSVLTTTVGGSVCRDQSKDFLIDFKKPRCSSPVGGSGRRDRSKSLIITFKKPRLPKRKLRAKKVPSKGAAPPAANVTTPTSSLAPPSTLVKSRVMWTKGIHHSFHLRSSWPVFPSLSWNCGLCSQWYPFLRDERSRQQDSEEHLQKQQDLSSLFRDTEESGECRRMDERFLRLTMEHARNSLAELEKKILSLRSECLDKGKVKQRIVQLLRRDERSREQDSEEHLQKQQDLSSLFRDMEESGKSRRMGEWFWRLQRSTSLREDVDKAVGHFLFLGDEARLRKERQRLYRFQKLLEQWSEAFTRGKHGVSFRVGECLKDVLAEVHKEISFLSWVESVQRSESGDERSRQQDSEEHLQKQQDLSSMFRDTEESGELWRMHERLRRVTMEHDRNSLAELETILSLACVESVQRSEFGLDEGKLKESVLQLLRRDERSREQDSEEHLQKQQDLSSLFRDMEESGKSRRTEERVWRLQRSTSLCASLYEDLDDAIVHFLLWGDEARLRKERQRLYRFQKLLEQWSEAFTRGKHGVSFRVGECLKDVLAEVHKEISFLSWVESVQRSESGSFPERLERLQEAWRLPRYSTLRKLHGRSSENFIQMGGSADQKTEDPTGVSSLYHTGRFCQSSSGKTRRSLSVRNTRKYLRRLHTRTAGGALRRGPQPDCKLESRLSGSQ